MSKQAHEYCTDFENSPFAGDIICNNNGGTVWLLDPNNPLSAVLIATGGTRGDHVGLVLNDGSLFLTQTNSIERLSCGRGCGFVVTPGVPEPLHLGYDDPRLR